MKSILFLASIASSASLMATLPTITANSVTMTQDQASRLVTISYTLQDAPAIVTVDIQTNGVSIGAEKFQYVGGDVNMKVQPGTHQITWQPMVEWPSAPQDSDARPAPPKRGYAHFHVMASRNRDYPCHTDIPFSPSNPAMYNGNRTTSPRTSRSPGWITTPRAR